MIDQVHRISGHDFYQVLDETTTMPDRLIQIRVSHAGQYVVSLYYWANTLYLAGIYQPGQPDGTGNRHYVFPDGYPDAFERVLGCGPTACPGTGVTPPCPAVAPARSGGSPPRTSRTRC
ncbi:hypothetical protein AW27_000035 [Streptomyces sp. PCS3-D2]|uniref:hypothetical protein n=1 Tax=Streptomyces sp. PCS3-D2 TaxID=1460244 RepID=UPI00272D3DAC|nr:hypothetical protein [Streptomyces sp. PCS3-D2]WKV70044.1 hypothetical protein AW27_000035 [Streptomyces sp. PCS3-D2]